MVNFAEMMNIIGLIHFTGIVPHSLEKSNLPRASGKMFNLLIFGFFSS